MEVSSIGLSEHRVNGLKFSSGVFTNFTQDHMDYHKTMDNYRDAKSLLFKMLSNKDLAVFNSDDPNWLYFRDATKANIFTFENVDMSSAEKTSTDILQKVKFYVHKSDLSGSLIEIDGFQAKFKLLGAFNAYNLAAAYTTLLSFDFDKEKIITALTKATPPPGRLQVISSDYAGKKPTVIVDYAHTPDALENVLVTLRELKNENCKLITVFGCGGDRDKLKRAEMGKIASQYSENVVVTSDNPRSEDPELIIKDIMTGIDNKSTMFVEISRKEAIHKIIGKASHNDMILIAGKGHETYQEIKGVRTHFDDREVALEALKFQHSIENE